MLTERLRTLEEAEIIYRHQTPTVPPCVTYGLTPEGREITAILDQLNTLAHTWRQRANPVPQAEEHTRVSAHQSQ